MPFLEILTRTIPSRPNFLLRCQESLKILRDPDWTQRVLMDDQLRGVSWANRNLSTIEGQGEWVWTLDDDDVCCYADLIGDLKAIAAAQRPDVILVRVYHAKWGMLPPHERWGHRPILGKFGGACVISRRDVWNAHRDAWTETYAADFWYANHLWDAGLRFAWLPVIAAHQTQQSNGAGEHAS